MAFVGGDGEEGEEDIFERAAHSVPTQRLILLQEILLSAKEHKPGCRHSLCNNLDTTDKEGRGNCVCVCVCRLSPEKRAQ